MFTSALGVGLVKFLRAPGEVRVAEQDMLEMAGMLARAGHKVGADCAGAR